MLMRFIDFKTAAVRRLWQPPKPSASNYLSFELLALAFMAEGASENLDNQYKKPKHLTSETITFSFSELSDPRS